MKLFVSLYVDVHYIYIWLSLEDSIYLTISFDPRNSYRNSANAASDIQRWINESIIAAWQKGI